MTIPTTISEVRAELERRANSAQIGSEQPRAEGVIALLFAERAAALREAAALLSAAEAREGVLREALEAAQTILLLAVDDEDLIDKIDRALGGPNAQQ